ncbi:MAG: hypothetical protein JG777_2541 [Clostridia bacterium]|nr:hypothetical protein [Clostridia bacterium]
MKIYRVVVQEYKTFIHKIVMYSVNNGENICINQINSFHFANYR